MTTPAPTARPRASTSTSRPRPSPAAGGVDVIASDQCQMQMIEDLSAWQPYAKAVVASEDTVNNTGLNYSTITSGLQANPG